jgi:O-antigen/teichoic acid export membrane protein
MRDSFRVLANSFFLMLNEGFHAVVSICVIAVLARYFSISKFGDYAFILALCNVFQVTADMGVNQIVIREIARRSEIAGEVFSASLLLRCVFSVVTFAIIAVSINLFTSSKEIIHATYIAALSVVSLFFYNLIPAIFKGFERMQFVTILDVTTRSVYLVLTLGVVWLGGGLKEIFLPALISRILGFGIGCLIVKRLFFTPTLKADYRLSWHLVKESYLLGIGRILRKASFSIDIILLKVLSASAAAGLFQGVYKPILQLMFIPRNISAALFPVFSRFFQNDKASLEKVYRDSFRLMIIIMLPIAIGMIFLSEEFVTLLLGERFFSAVPAFRVLAAVWGLMFMSTLLLRLLTAIDRQELVTVCIGIALAINVALDLVLIPRNGFVGAAWATLFAELSLITTSFLFMSKYLTRLSLWKVFCGPCGGGILMTLFCLWLMKSGFLLKTLLVLPVGVLLYFAYLVLTKTLTTDEYKWFKDILKIFRNTPQARPTLITKW